MKIMFFLMAIFGLSFLVYSLFETRAHGELFFARDRYCIERFRKAEKAADVAACCHNVAKGYFGLLMMLLGLTRLLQREMDMDGMYVIAFILFFLDVLVLELTVRRFRLKEVKESIREQWERQKRISAEHDHEVNMYRAARTLTEDYARHLVMLGAGMIILKVFFI